MRRYEVKRHLSEESAAALAGTFLGDSSWDLLIPQEPSEVYDESGALLLKYLPDEIPQEQVETGWDIMRTLAGAGGVKIQIKNRGTATGFRAVRPTRSGGYKSGTIEVPPVPELRGAGSSIIGSYERVSARQPLCRLTSWNMAHPERFEQLLPMFQTIDGVFKREVPDRWKAQMDEQQATHPAWRIHGTSFTTVTVNRDFRTAVHTDRGDLKEGFGVLTALRAGHYEGCYFVLPAYRVAVDMRTRCVLLVDVHEWHGNTELVGVPGHFERISCVLYYRRRMKGCLSPEQEIVRAQRRRPGDPIW